MLQKLHLNKLKMFPKRDCFIPNLGTFYSQLGNNSFPTWEYYKKRINVLSNSSPPFTVLSNLNSAMPLGLSKNSTEPGDLPHSFLTNSTERSTQTRDRTYTILSKSRGKKCGGENKNSLLFAFCLFFSIFATEKRWN